MARRSLLDRHPLAVFSAVTYALSWTCWLVWSVLPGRPTLRTVAFVLGGFGPFFAATLLTALSGESVRAWIGRVFRFRVAPRYYAVALGLPVVALGLAGLTHWAVLGGTLTPESLPSPLEYPIILALVLLFGGGQEEPGWRGYLLPRLQEEHSSLRAALVVGVVWAAWHAPLFVLPGAIQNDIAPWLYLPQVVAMSVVLTWLTNVSRGSVLPAMLLHAGGNAVVNFYPVGGAAGAVATTGYALLAAVVAVAAIAVTVWKGPSLGATTRETPRDPPVAETGG